MNSDQKLYEITFRGYVLGLLLCLIPCGSTSNRIVIGTKFMLDLVSDFWFAKLFCITQTRLERTDLPTLLVVRIDRQLVKRKFYWGCQWMELQSSLSISKNQAPHIGRSVFHVIWKMVSRMSEDLSKELIPQMSWAVDHIKTIPTLASFPSDWWSFTQVDNFRLACEAHLPSISAQIDGPSPSN